MNRRDRLRRVVILCSNFTRNLAYHRAGKQHSALLLPTHPHADFWLQANANFLDICVIEWCKLFADQGGEHYWQNVVGDKIAFKEGLLAHTQIMDVAFDDLIKEIRAYRDKFVAHLDSGLEFRPPKLTTYHEAVIYYHAQVVAHEAGIGDLAGLADTSEKMLLGYDQCRAEADAVISRYSNLTQTIS